MGSKKGQQAVGMSFGMIFALFLIVVFISIAFIAVKFFFDFGETASIGGFYQDLQEDINTAKKGQQSDSDFEIDLPSGIDSICFANLSAAITNPGPDYDAIEIYEGLDSNLFLVPPEKAGDLERKKITGINISKTTQGANPYCVETDFDLRIRKDFYDRLVWIE